MNKLRNAFGALVLRISALSMISCLLTVVAVSANVVLRKLSGGRLVIPGCSELSAYLLVVTCMPAIPALHVRNGHIRVELLLDRLTIRHRRLWLAAVSAIECAVSALLTAGSASKLRLFLETGTRTDVLNFPKWPFALACLVGFAELTVLLILDTGILLQNCFSAKEPDKAASHPPVTSNSSDRL